MVTAEFGIAVSVRDTSKTLVQTCIPLFAQGYLLPQVRSAGVHTRVLPRPHNVTQLALPNRIQKPTLDIRTHTKITFRATYISTIWQLATSIQGFFCFN